MAPRNGHLNTSYLGQLKKGQLENLSRSYNNNSAITIRPANNELPGPR